MNLFMFEKELISKKRGFNPAAFFIISFAIVILTGAILLSLPISSAKGEFTNFLTALFTATSATCVTGLVVVDTGTYWSHFGHLVILLLIQIGGLSYAVISTGMMLLLNRRIQLRERLILQYSLNTTSLRGIVSFLKNVLITVFIFESIGALSLFFVFIKRYPLLRSIKFAIFHSVSAFCNAGFDLIGGFRSFTDYVSDPLLVFTITTLIIVGGIGFIVIHDIIQRFMGKRIHLSLHSKMALFTTLFLILIGTIVIFILEYNNPNTLKTLNFWGKFLGAYFQSVTPRTAGFNTLDIGKMNPSTLLFIIVLMFIGASPGGTGGGIKTVTFLVLWLSVSTIILERKNVHFKDRTIPWENVKRAYIVFLLSLTLVIISWFLLLITEPFPPLNILFEVVSAFGTVGLSTGITPYLSPFARLVIILTMFLGRVGTVTAGMAILIPVSKRSQVEYPSEEVSIG
ncbi:TrkH family potassium uptake protein [Dictyoglomus sp.]|uniref:TrkH family potassium uptake protein n=1 Tax=Dictyoglomus sp. TaxID=28205 RepID=UPI003D09EC96